MEIFNYFAISLFLLPLFQFTSAELFLPTTFKESVLMSLLPFLNVPSLIIWFVADDCAWTFLYDLWLMRDFWRVLRQSVSCRKRSDDYLLLKLAYGSTSPSVTFASEFLIPSYGATPCKLVPLRDIVNGLHERSLLSLIISLE